MERPVLFDDGSAPRDVQRSDQQHSVGKVRLWARSALRELHGAVGLRSLRRAGWQPQVRRHVEDVAVAGFRPHGRAQRRECKVKRRVETERKWKRKRPQDESVFRTGASGKYAGPREGRSFPNTMTTLVSGATGFVGSHVVRRLAASGESVRALARPGSRRQALEGVAVEWVEGDLRDEASLDRALAGVNRVYHVAADYRLWSRHPQEIYDSNVTGTKNLLAAALRARVQRVVYTSTVATIAVPHGNALPDETNRASVDEMIGNYKRSKLLAEQEALRAAHEGLPVVIVNPTTPVGPGDWKPTPTGRILLDFLQGRMPAYVDAGLNFVAVEDVADGHLLAAERGRVGERYLLGGRNMTLKELLDALASITGLPAPTRRIPHSVALVSAVASTAFARFTGREPRIPLEGVRIARHSMFVNDAKARKELGYTPGPVEAALERAVNWYVANGYVKLPSRAQVAQASAA